MKSSREIARTPLARAVRSTATFATLTTAMLATAPAHAATTIDVVDFGGNNRQILLDANKDAFVVDANSGQLYVYDASKTIAPSPDRVYSNRVAPIPGVHVYGNQILDTERGVLLGEILVDHKRNRQEISVLGYRAGTAKGYLDVDFNDNYRDGYTGEKSDARITQVNALSFVKTYKGLKGKNHWLSLGTLGIKEHRKSFPFLVKTLKYTFTAPTTGNYQAVLRDFKHQKNDLDLRLVDLSTGQILGSSYSEKSTELVTAPLKAGQKYGVVLERKSATRSVAYTLNLKPVTDRVERTPSYSSNYNWIASAAPGASIQLSGTIRPITPFEHFSHFADISDASGDVNAGIFFDPGWDASGDASGDASWDASGDASGDSLFSMVAGGVSPHFWGNYDFADYDVFLFFSTPGVFNYSIKNNGGTTLTQVVDVFANYAQHAWVGESNGAFNVEHRTYGPIGVGLVDNKNGVGPIISNSDDTIEYEVLISPN